MPESEKKQPDPLSKSQLKRDMLALQELGEALIALSPSQLAKIPLPDILLDAIKKAHTLKTHEAKRRHLQYIGKIMRKVDPEPIQTALNKIKLSNAQVTAKFHKIEEWRDKLVSEGDEAIQVLLQENSQIDRQHLRQLVRKAQQDKAKNKDTGGDTELFRYLREVLSGG